MPKPSRLGPTRLSLPPVSKPRRHLTDCLPRSPPPPPHPDKLPSTHCREHTQCLPFALSCNASFTHTTAAPQNRCSAPAPPPLKPAARRTKQCRGRLKCSQLPAARRATVPTAPRWRPSPPHSLRDPAPPPQPTSVLLPAQSHFPCLLAQGALGAEGIDQAVCGRARSCVRVHTCVCTRACACCGSSVCEWQMCEKQNRVFLLCLLCTRGRPPAWCTMRLPDLCQLRGRPWPFVAAWVRGRVGVPRLSKKMPWRRTHDPPPGVPGAPVDPSTRGAEHPHPP
jgi:hypothetical protein